MTSQWCFFCSTRGHHYSDVMSSWGCFYFGTFTFVWSYFYTVPLHFIPLLLMDCWTATFYGLRHIWAMFNFHLLTYFSAGCRGGCGLHLLTVESSSSASQFFFYAEKSWRRLSDVRLQPAGNTEKFQPAASAKVIFPLKCFFSFFFN